MPGNFPVSIANCMTISRTNDHAKFKSNILYRMLYKNLIIITENIILDPKWIMAVLSTAPGGH